MVLLTKRSKNSSIRLMIAWVRKNWLVLLLGLIIVYLLWRPSFSARYDLGLPSLGGDSRQLASEKAPTATLFGDISRSILPPVRDYAPSEQADRLVVQESSLSLVVKNVREASDRIIDQAKSNGGYMVSSSLNQPEEAPFAMVVLRVPAKSLKEVLAQFCASAIKVSSENLVGTDVTDEYTDIEARLATLDKTKKKFEEIMDKAVRVEEILQVQREIINLQSQIDSLKGRQQYLAKTAELAKVTVYLSTDEFALPYAPAQPFRPEVIFKQAVRSLVLTFRGIAKVAIWAAVYSILLVPAWLIFRFLKTKKSQLHK